MIYKLSIRDATKTPVRWLPKADALKKPREFEFKPGLNILWGRNGSGKTALIQILARLFHCTQGNHPVVTSESLRQLVGGDALEATNIRKGLKVVHDGQGVRHFDPSHVVGLVGGSAGFDWDFGAEGITNTMFRGSAGQTTLFRFDRLIEEIVTGTVPSVTWKFPQERTGNDVWGQRMKLAAHFLKGNATKGQPTLLLDEPERSYDLNTQIGIWRFLRSYSDQIQFIVASHALFALRIPEAHYIELSPRYLAGSEAALEILHGWSAEKPSKIPEGAAKRAHDPMKRRREGKSHGD